MYISIHNSAIFKLHGSAYHLSNQMTEQRSTKVQKYTYAKNAKT